MSSDDQSPPVSLPIKRHKNMIFRPIASFNSLGKVNSYLSKVHKPKKGFFKSKKNDTKEQIAHNRYYRVYKHKYQGYVIYMSDRVKRRYGGIRKRRGRRQ